MDTRIDGEYYTTRQPEFLKAFDAESQYWRPVIAIQYGADFAEILLREARVYCFLDYPKSKMGLSRTMTLSEGDTKCNHRFKEGRKTEFGWPPPFLKRSAAS
jgi:hypothetical protein